MKKILAIATGGTISCEPSADGLVPALSGEAILTFVPALKNICAIDCLELMQLDSSNLVPDDWVKMAETIAQNYDNYDGFVITHGTDTMAYSAAALKQMLGNLHKPVILTGAQLPIEAAHTDAKRNLFDAFLAAAADVGGVFLVFDHFIHDGLVVKKTHSEDFIGFSSINRPIAGKIKNHLIDWQKDYLYQADNSTPIDLHTHLFEKIFVLKLIPGLDPAIIDTLAQLGYRGLIIEGYGAGGVPTADSPHDFLPAIQKAIANGMSIICTTQCQNNGAQLDKYPIGILAERAGAISGHTATLETLTVCLMQALATATSPTAVKQQLESLFITSF